MKIFKKNGAFLVIIMVILSLMMLFLGNALTAKGGISGQSYNLDEIGFVTIFGKEKSGFDFNLLGFLAVIFTALGAVLAFLPVLPAKIRFALAAIVMIVGGVFFFVYPTTLGNSLLTIKAGLPIILAGIFALIGGVINVGLVLVNNK